MLKDIKKMILVVKRYYYPKDIKNINYQFQSNK